jgi:Tol biopolymer transport system component
VELENPAIRAQTQKILASTPFLNAERLKRFLLFVVEQSIEGRAGDLKEYVVATEVFDRKETFDSRLHSVVRVEATKLRAKLREYYENEGTSDRILIELPKGTYAPVFRLREKRRASRYRWLVAAAVAAGIGAALWILARPRAPAPPAVTRLAVTLVQGDLLAIEFQPAVAFSYDGTRLLYVAGPRGEAGRARLYLRRMDQFEATPIPGTEGASGPFFSPDGRWAGFFADGKLKKVALSGGAPQALCEAPGGRGGSWGSDGTIAFTPGSAPGIGLSRISAAGGKPRVMSTPDANLREVAHRWPEILPHGKAVLFTIWTGGGFDTSRIAVLSLKSGKHRVVIEGGSNAHYSTTGHLIFYRAGGLLAAPFDLGRLEVTGPPFPILENVMRDERSGAAQFSIAGSGSLVYVAGGAVAGVSTLAWVDRKGTIQPAIATPRDYFFPRLSPEGERLAVRVNRDIWVYGIKDQTFNRLTFEAGLHNYPIWTPDGKRVTFTSNRLGPFNLFWKPADGSGLEERLTTSAHPQFPSSWSPDGRWLTFDESGSDTGSDIWLLPADGARKPRPLLQTPFDECGATFSPNGRWLAYTSNQSGRFEVYVQPFPEVGARWQISSDGGAEPVWARNGRELFFRNGDKMMAVDVTTDGKFHAGRPRLLFEGRYEAYSLTTSYDVSPDGQQFTMVKAGEPAPTPAQFNVVLNWDEQLKRGAGPAR